MYSAGQVNKLYCNKSLTIWNIFYFEKT